MTKHIPISGNRLSPLPRALGACLVLSLPITLSMAAGLSLGTAPAAAQTQSLPGIVVKQPEEKPDAAGEPNAGKKSASASNEQPRRRTGANVTRPVVIVNGLPITNEEIDMRANLLSLGPQLNDRVKSQFQALAKSKQVSDRWNGIRDRIIRENQHTGNVELIKSKLTAAMKTYQMDISRQAFKSARDGFAKTLRTKAREDLIDEQIKLNAARELGLKLNEQLIDSAVDNVMKDRAEKSKMSKKEFAAHLRTLGTDYEMMRQSTRAQFIWREVVRMKFRPFISPNLKEVDEVVTSAPGEGVEADDAQMKLHRISMKLPPKASQQQKIQTQLAAERIMKSFKGCDGTSKLAAASKDATFEDLGTKKLSEIPEPARSLLRYAKAGEILPPQPAYDGLHLYALCERSSSVKVTDENRKEAEAKIIGEALDRRSRGLLLDLRRRARIEER